MTNIAYTEQAVVWCRHTTTGRVEQQCVSTVDST